MATLYVDPDNAGASDSHDYTEAQDSATPLRTSAAAVLLVQTGDTIRMVDPSSPFPQFFATNALTSADTVTIEGADADTAFHLRNFFLQGLSGWTIRNAITFGGNQGDISSFNACADMTFENWEAQRGGANILSALGDWLWDGGSLQAPLDSPASGFLDGVGWRFYHTFSDIVGIGNAHFLNYEFSNVQGEDGCQFIGSGDGILHHTGELRFTNCYWHDFTQSDQPGAPHTDGVQTLGGNQIIFDSCKFERLPSMIISTDDYVQQMTLINCMFLGDNELSFKTQFFGIFGFTARNCTWDSSGLCGLRIGYDSRLATTNPVEDGNQHLVIDVANCICDQLVWTDGIDDPSKPQAATITTSHNLLGTGSNIGEDDTEGFAEYGHTDDTTLELANSPAGTNSLAIDAGLSHADDSLVPLLDRLGRPRNGAGTDLGCHESDPISSIVVDPRAIRVISVSPAVSATDIDPETQVQLVAFPRPGVHLDDATVTADSFFVKDPGGTIIPSNLTITNPDGQNHQILVLSLVGGDLYPYVVYTVTATNDIADTEGSVLALTTVWHFTVLGTAPDPAIGYSADGGGDPDDSTFMSAGFLRDATTRALIVRVAD